MSSRERIEEMRAWRAVLASLMLLTACSAAVSIDEEDLAGRWILDSATVQAEELAIDSSISSADPPPAWLEFGDESVLSGETACSNKIRGRYEIVSGRVDFVEARVQAGGCPARDDTERQAVQAVANALLNVVFSQELVLAELVDGGEVLTLSAETTILMFRRGS